MIRRGEPWGGPASSPPTATHEVGEPHDTPARRLRVAPGGTGVGWTDHALPFHRSTRVTCSPALLV